MNTVQWTCQKCKTVNVIVLKEDDERTALSCRECFAKAKLATSTPVVVLEQRPVHHTGH